MDGYLVMLWSLGALLLVWLLYMGYRSWVGQGPFETRGDLGPEGPLPGESGREEAEPPRYKHPPAA